MSVHARADRHANFRHLSKLDMCVGNHGDQDEVIGRVGSTGRATGPHLHEGMTFYTARIDPLRRLNRG